MTADPYVATMQIVADPEQLFRYFTEPEALKRWMGRHAVLDPMPGGECSLDIYRINVRGQDLEVDRPRRLVISWVMKGQRQPPVAGGTLVQLLHRDLPDVEAPAHALGWPISFTDPSASGLVRIRALTLG